MNLLAIIHNMRLPDVLDIIFISIVSYHLLIWFWGTKAFKALVGLLLLSGVFTLAESWGLFLTTWVFQIMWQVFVILLIILFQKEIRQMLEKFNPLQSFGLKSETGDEEWIPSFVKWAFETADKKIGALVVFERNELIYDLITKGILLECIPKPEMLDSIFQKNSPLHDGAVLIGNGRILKASCYLPLTTEEDLPQKWGTRHRAALGLTEQCDAWVMIISEERGEISMAMNNKIKKVNDEKHLTAVLRDSVQKNSDLNISIKDKIISLVTRKFTIKASVLCAVSVIWMLFAGQQNVETRLDIPLEIGNIPQHLHLSEPVNPLLSVTFRGLRKDVSVLNDENVNSLIDLSLAREGERYYTITTGHLSLPNDRVDIINIKPSRIRLSLEKRR